MRLALQQRNLLLHFRGESRIETAPPQHLLRYCTQIYVFLVTHLAVLLTRTVIQERYFEGET